MSIVTKTGDSGETALIGGRRVSKMNTRIHAIGSADELDAMLGVIRAVECPKELGERILIIQRTLYHLKTDLASPASHQTEPCVTQNDVDALEKWITEAEKKISPLTRFIIPGGTPCAANLHLARTVCRRAERWVVQLAREEAINMTIVRYLNRLSDWLFIETRIVNHEAGIHDDIVNN